MRKWKKKKKHERARFRFSWLKEDYWGRFSLSRERLKGRRDENTWDVSENFQQLLRALYRTEVVKYRIRGSRVHSPKFDQPCDDFRRYDDNDSHNII